ncbi:MAG: DUF948 domain-containing protein [Thermodesulfovibrio sp.]|nr:DUF948 domain-containing protein [Thermodesulfovibrio sp.]
MSETLLVLLSIGYFLATVSLVAALVFFIVVAIELRKGVSSFKEFINTTKTKLDPTISETEKVIQGIKISVDDINQVTERIRTLSETVDRLIVIAEELIESLQKLKSSISVRSSALKTAIAVATQVFLENLKKGGK